MTALQILKTYCFSTQLPCFSKHCAYWSTSFLHSLEHLFFGCVKNQSCTASFTSSPIENFQPHNVSLSGPRRQKSEQARAHMGRVTKNSQISVSRVVTAWVRQRAFSGLKKNQSSFLFCAKSWLQLISHHNEILSTCYCDSKSMLHSGNVHTGPWKSLTPIA